MQQHGQHPVETEPREKRAPASTRPSTAEAPPKKQLAREPEDAEEVDFVELALTGSFPASDPPPWTLGPPRWAKKQSG